MIDFLYGQFLYGQLDFFKRLSELAQTHHWLNGLPYCNHIRSRPSTAPVLGVCEWSPEGLYDKSVSLIPHTDEILKLVKKK